MIVHGRGPKPARLMIIGERPGEWEASSGIPFHPRAAVGKELTRYLLHVLRLDRDDVFLTNLIRKYDPKQKDERLGKQEIEFWSQDLARELAEVRPEVIVTLGREATRFFLGNVNLEDVYGLPHRWRRWQNDAVVIPTYLRLYDTELQPLIWYSFLQCQRVLRGELAPHEHDTGRGFHYVEAHTALEVDWLSGHSLIAVDTEGLPGKPWGLSAAVCTRSATVVRQSSREAIVSFAAYLSCMKVILHNSLHDLAVLRDMGIEIIHFEDTMVMAFLLGLEPQGLKSLAYRYRGIARDSYDEVVGPAQRLAAIVWLEKCAMLDWGEAPGEHGREGVDSDHVWSINRRVENILGFWKGEIFLTEEPSKKTLAARKKLLELVGCAVGKQNALKTGWIECRAPRRVYAELKGSFPGVFDLSCLELCDAAPDPHARWKIIQSEHEDQANIVEQRMGPMPEPGLEGLEEMFGDAGAQKAIEYSAGDADDTFTIYPILKKKIEELELTAAYNLDISVIPMIDRMMHVGFMADKDYFQSLGKELEAELESDLAKMECLIGRRVNPNSSKQVAGLLFGDLKLPVQQYTEHHEPSTADEVIEALRLISDHPVLPLISDYRELTKMKGTYADKLWRWLGSDSRIHPKLRITRVPSGRLACSEPNLMAIPVRSQRMLNGRRLGKAIRDGFVARPGCVLGSWDLDQIEMRVLADRSGDPTLADVFLTGQDIHQKTASLVFGLPMDQVGKGTWQRDSAKNVGFGIVYGITAKGLQLQLKLRSIDRSESECQEMIDAYLVKAYPGVRQLMSDKIIEARRYGFVRSMLGRLRYLPGIHSSNNRLRSEAERICLNHDIQTTAQEVIKLAMSGIWQRVLPAIHSEGWYCEPILQIHDELIFELDERIISELDVMIRSELQNAVRLTVPIGAKGSFARSWGDLK